MHSYVHVHLQYPELMSCRRFFQVESAGRRDCSAVRYRNSAGGDKDRIYSD